MDCFHPSGIRVPSIVPVAVLTNLFIAALPVVMAVGFACLLTTALPVEWCTWLGVLAGYLFDTLKWVVSGVANLPASALRVHALPTWWIVMWYVALAMLLLHLCNRSKMLKKSCVRRCKSVQGDLDQYLFQRRMYTFGIFLFAFSVVGVGLQLMPQTRRKSQMTIAAMGHGCGIVLKSREGSALREQPCGHSEQHCSVNAFIRLTIL